MKVELAALALSSLAVGLCADLPDSAATTGLRGFPTPLQSTLPFDVDSERVSKLVSSGNIAAAQREFDVLAWQAFLALNWPADDQGRPLPEKDFNDANAPRVWSFWRESSTIFLSHGERPEPWEHEMQSPGVQPLFRAKAAWRQHVTNADQNFQAFSGPLVDQNGKWVRYEVLVNREEFDYLVQNVLYNLEGQEAFSKRLENNQVDFPINDQSRRHGAIEIKLAWKEMGPNDDRSRFFTTKAEITRSEPSTAGQTGPETRNVEVGLVGMHLAMRTQSSPEWIWASFEQVDNDPDDATPVDESRHYNFYNPKLKGEPVNLLPPKNAIINPKTGQLEPEPDPAKATTWIESLTTKPVQVVRVTVPPQGQLNPLDALLYSGAAELNAQVQSILREEKSVFQFYKLISTQWPIHPNAPAFAGGANSAPESITRKMPGEVVPVFLVNTTMETYFQKGKQPAGPLEQDDRLDANAPPIDSTPVIGTESCVGCHYSSGSCIGFKMDEKGRFRLDDFGNKEPIYGENSHFGKTGNAGFSWLLQIEARSTRQGVVPSPGQVLIGTGTRSAQFLDITLLLERQGVKPTESPHSENHQ